MWWNFVLYLLLLLLMMTTMTSRVALLNPNCSVFYFHLISWLVYYPFVCALFVINLIKVTSLVLRIIFIYIQVLKVFLPLLITVLSRLF